MSPAAHQDAAVVRRALLVAAFAFLPAWLGISNALQEVDPAQYAEVARRMFDSGDWAHLRQNGGPFLNKPPFAFWAISGAFALLGETAAAVRLPSLLAALALLFATYRIGRRLYEPRTGALGAALLAGSVAFQLMLVDPKVDMLVTALMALSVLCLVEARERPGLVWAAWAFAGLGILTKGPIGLAAPAAAVAPEALRRRWGSKEAGSLRSRLRPFHPAAGLLLVAAMLAPWYLEILGEYGGGGAYYLLWDQSFGRLVGARSYRNGYESWFFVHTAAWAFLPFFPALAYALYARARAFAASRFALPHDERRILLWWLLIPFAAISASSYKLPQYLYWLAPPASLLAARALVELSERAARGPLRALYGIHAALGAVAAAAVFALSTWCFPAGALPAAEWTAFAAAAVALAAWLGRRWQPDLRLAALAVLPIAAFHYYDELCLHPALTAFEPDPAWGDIARREDPAGKVLAFVGAPPTNASAFYARRDAQQMGPEELRERVARGEVHLAVIRTSEVPAVEAAGVAVTPLGPERPLFPTSRPTRAFLLAGTRPGTLEHFVIAKVAPAQAASRSAGSP